MFNPELTTSVQNFVKLFADLPDADLDRPWQWKGHDEGLRFAFFVVSRELRDLAVRLATALPPASPVHFILSQYHSAVLDLQAVLHGLSHEDANLAPSEKDWPVRRVFAHILGADIGFTAVVNFALEGHRAGKWTTTPMAEEDEIRLVGMSETEYRALMDGPYENMLAYHLTLHPRIISQFSTISPAELDLPAVFWEPETFPIRYRLHRYEAHLRQHTIQIEKTLTAIDLAPSETKRLIRMLYAALAQVDGLLIGAAATAPVNEICRSSIELINATASQVAGVLNNHPSPGLRDLAM